MRQDIENFADNKLTIVTFNYDRSLEQYLGRALEVSGADQVGKKLSSLGFIHVYGTLGGKPYIDSSAREYADIEEPSSIQQAANGIKIIDREDDKELLSQFELAKNALVKAKTVVILGFGWEEKNVERLALQGTEFDEGVFILGTVWGMSQMRRTTVHEEMKRIGLKGKIRFEDTNCLGVFENHFRFR